MHFRKVVALALPFLIGALCLQAETPFPAVPSGFYALSKVTLLSIAPGSFTAGRAYGSAEGWKFETRSCSAFPVYSDVLIKYEDGQSKMLFDDGEVCEVRSITPLPAKSIQARADDEAELRRLSPPVDHSEEINGLREALRQAPQPLTDREQARLAALNMGASKDPDVGTGWSSAIRDAWIAQRESQQQAFDNAMAAIHLGNPFYTLKQIEYLNKVTLGDFYVALAGREAVFIYTKLCFVRPYGREEAAVSYKSLSPGKIMFNSGEVCDIQSLTVIQNGHVEPWRPHSSSTPRFPSR
ncbi:MAG: hypothetical protein ACJ74Y_16830 [Bryobacteraceae bacterium]